MPAQDRSVIVIEPNSTAPPAIREWLQRDIDRSRAPGLQYVAVDAAGVVAEFAGGWADLRERRAMTPETTLMAYSMTKTITAVAVLQAVGRGLITLDAPVARYLPAAPYGEDITVRQLLSHTSGIPNPIPLRWVHAAKAHDGFAEALALDGVWRAHPRLSHRPGTRFAYSNIGYWMLGQIIERTTGRPFSAWVTAEILEPLALAPSGAAFTINAPGACATGYVARWSAANLAGRWLIDRQLLGDYDGRWRRIAVHYPNGPAFGGLLGTSRAFGAFLQDQLQPHSRLLNDETRALLYEPQRTRDGATVPMTLGWHRAEDSPIFFKEGGGAGFQCLMRLYPERGLGSVVMTNATGYNVHGCLDAVDALLPLRR